MTLITDLYLPDDVATRKLAEKLFRKEHPRLFPFSPYERTPELSDLWESDQQKYIERVEKLLQIIKDEA